MYSGSLLGATIGLFITMTSLLANQVEVSIAFRKTGNAAAFVDLACRASVWVWTTDKVDSADERHATGSRWLDVVKTPRQPIGYARQCYVEASGLQSNCSFIRKSEPLKRHKL